MREPSTFIRLLSRNALGDGAACGLDLGLGRCAAGNLHRELLGEVADGEDLDFRTLVVRESLRRERLDGDLRAGIEHLLQGGEVHAESLRVEAGVVEAALRKTAHERHLTAFEAEFLLVALARVLALVAARRGLAHARTATTTDAFAALAGSRGVCKV